ncbi:putative flagellar antigen [Trypanosoma theileri]|uniref:Putative flagellar antigen n=1 Tax=Trypanosoma theileri TaxID=67003 RepID=A0A1X0P265_9TRYP|nr:putative flagellar antigen [Trypanosoma theileri]ORC90490.1 putative flagellar antigen [Trypanosoma theileri]
MISSPSSAAVEPAAENDVQIPLHPTKPTTPKPAKPDYFPLSRVRQPMGPATYPGIAAAEDAANGLLVSDALHDVTFYAETTHLLPDAGRPVLNSVLFSQRHIVNDTPSIEEEIAAIDERTRLWRATRLQQVATEREHSQQKSSLDEKVESRVREREVAERERTLRRISRMLDSLIPDVDKALEATEEAKPETLGARRREDLMKQWKEREESKERLIRDMRLAERRLLVERQYKRNVEERNSLESQHYFSYMEQLIDERQAYRQLKEAFYNGKILIGVIDDESKMRCRLKKDEENSWLDILEQVGKLIPLTVAQLVGENALDTEQISEEVHTGNNAETKPTETKIEETAAQEEEPTKTAAQEEEPTETAAQEEEPTKTVESVGEI